MFSVTTISLDFVAFITSIPFMHSDILSEQRTVTHVTKATARKDDNNGDIYLVEMEVQHETWNS